LQDILAILIVTIAAAFLTRRALQNIAHKRSGCGACSNCPSAITADSPTLVTISPIASHAKAPGREEKRAINETADKRG
jgi:hypothetical protein